MSADEVWSSICYLTPSFWFSELFCSPRIYTLCTVADNYLNGLSTLKIVTLDRNTAYNRVNQTTSFCKFMKHLFHRS